VSELFVRGNDRLILRGDDPTERHEVRVHQNRSVNDAKPYGRFRGVKREIVFVVKLRRYRVPGVDDVLAAPRGTRAAGVVSAAVDERPVEPQQHPHEKATGDRVRDGGRASPAFRQVPFDGRVAPGTAQEVRARHLAQFPDDVRVAHQHVHFQRRQRAVGEDDDYLERARRAVAVVARAREETDRRENHDQLHDQQEQLERRAVNVVPVHARPVRVQQLIEAQLPVRGQVERQPSAVQRHPLAACGRPNARNNITSTTAKRNTRLPSGKTTLNQRIPRHP